MIKAIAHVTAMPAKVCVSQGWFAAKKGLCENW